MSDDEVQRAALRRHLQNPEFNARMRRMYEQLVQQSGVDTNVSSDNSTQLVFPAVPSRSFSLSSSPDVREIPAAPTTIEDLWAGNWQRSVGSYTLTRFDDTIRLETGDGARVVYSPIKCKGGFTWKTEHHDESGRKTETRRYEQTFDTAREALFEMHRAAHSEIDERVL